VGFPEEQKGHDRLGRITSKVRLQAPQKKGPGFGRVTGGKGESKGIRAE